MKSLVLQNERLRINKLAGLKRNANQKHYQKNFTKMNNDDTITIDLSDVQPVEFTWNESDMSTGFIAQEVGTASPNTITLNSGISITTTGLAASGSYTISTPYDDMEQRLARLEKIIAEEEEVRRTHPAVQMAYDEYRLLYILAKKNPGDLLTDQ
jgi:prophage DNA circulation protein